MSHKTIITCFAAIENHLGCRGDRKNWADDFIANGLAAHDFVREEPDVSPCFELKNQNQSAGA